MERQFDPDTLTFGVCRPGHALRPLDWRWRVAASAARSDRVPDAALADGYVAAAAAHLGRTAFPAPPPPGVVAAVAAAAAVHAGPAAARTAVEAHLLAGVPVADAGAAGGLGPAAGAAYEAVFYDIRDRLGRPGVRALAVPRSCGPIAPDDTDTLLKLAAMQGGPVALAGLVAHLGAPRPAEPRPLHLAAAAALVAWVDWLAGRLWVLGHTVEPATDDDRRVLLDVVKAARAPAGRQVRLAPGAGPTAELAWVVNALGRAEAELARRSRAEAVGRGR